jgi:DNA-binding NarL/FixJ family response regulator
MALSLYICEDSIEFRENLKKYIPKFGDIVVCGQAGSAEDALNDSALYKCDVMLLDLEMPGKGGLWVIDKIAGRENAPEIMVLTTHDSGDKVFVAIKNGAAGYLVKGSSFKKIVEGLQDIATGGTVIDPALAARFWNLFSASVGHWESVPWSLTEVELEILTLVTKGLSNPELGSAMGKSRTNIKKILARIFRKLNVNSRVEAVTLALKAGIITLD